MEIDQQTGKSKETETQLAERIRNKNAFRERMIRLTTLACSNVDSDDFDLEYQTKKSEQSLDALNATEGLQQMLAAQMLSIHRLQQLSMTFANASDQISSKQYYTNTAIKLANCFTQQANLLAKLQGHGVQKIVVERVDVHQGGQAVVGDINLTKRASGEYK